MSQDGWNVRFVVSTPPHFYLISYPSDWKSKVLFDSEMHLNIKTYIYLVVKHIRL